MKMAAYIGSCIAVTLALILLLSVAGALFQGSGAAGTAAWVAGWFVWGALMFVVLPTILLGFGYGIWRRRFSSLPLRKTALIGALAAIPLVIAERLSGIFAESTTVALLVGLAALVWCFVAPAVLTHEG